MTCSEGGPIMFDTSHGKTLYVSRAMKKLNCYNITVVNSLVVVCAAFLLLGQGFWFTFVRVHARASQCMKYCKWMTSYDCRLCTYLPALNLELTTCLFHITHKNHWYTLTYEKHKNEIKDDTCNIRGRLWDIWYIATEMPPMVSWGLPPIPSHLDPTI